jgi:branched-chain amino acid transport system substrate-binding protein
MNSPKNEIPLLLCSLLITGGVLAAGYWWFMGGRDSNNAPGQATELSDGRKNLVASEAGGKPDFIQAKNAGIAAMAAKKYPIAVAKFAQALQLSSNAPETKIYFNNAQIGDGTALKIAVAVPIQSDSNGSLEILRGVAQAQEEVNKAGGINGILLKVVIADDTDKDDSDKKENVIQVAGKLSRDEQVLGVVGHYSSDASIAASKVYREAKLVSISPVSTSVELTKLSNPYFFRTVPSDAVSGKALADYALHKIQRKKAMVFFSSKSGYSKSLKDEFAKVLKSGGGKVEEKNLSAPGFSATQSLNQAAADDVIMLAADTNTLNQALQVVQFNPKKLPILGGDDVYTTKALEVGRQQAVGMVVAVPWHIDADPGAKFAQSSRQMWRAAVNWRTVTAYDAAQSLITALQANPSRQGVREAIAANGFQAVGGSGAVSFLPSGDRQAGIQLVQVAAGKKSGVGFDFVPMKK